MAQTKELLIIVPGKEVTTESIFHLLVAKTGEVLATHLCSSSHYAMGDLYLRRPNLIEAITNKLGEHEVKFIDETDLDIEEIYHLNKKWYEENTDEEVGLTS